MREALASEVEWKRCSEPERRRPSKACLDEREGPTCTGHLPSASQQPQLVLRQWRGARQQGGSHHCMLMQHADARACTRHPQKAATGGHARLCSEAKQRSQRPCVGSQGCLTQRQRQSQHLALASSRHLPGLHLHMVLLPRGHWPGLAREELIAGELHG